MPIVRRRALEPKSGSSIRIKPNPRKQSMIDMGFSAQAENKEYADSVEEYVFGLPKEPIMYSSLIVDWILPYQEIPFCMFGVYLKFMPRYRSLIDNKVMVTGLLVETYTGDATRKVKQLIEGPRGTWHGKIKFFAKANVRDE